MLVRIEYCGAWKRLITKEANLESTITAFWEFGFCFTRKESLKNETRGLQPRTAFDLTFRFIVLVHILPML